MARPDLPPADMTAVQPAPEHDESAVDGDEQQVPSSNATCLYPSPFSGSMECLEYVGEGWGTAESQVDCDGRADSMFAMGQCDDITHLGACVVAEGQANEIRTFILGDNEEQCALNALGCRQFAGGVFVPSDICADVEIPDDEADSPTIGGDVFIPPILICSPPVDGVEGMSADGNVCTWQSIGGCTEPGRKYNDYAECDTVMSQRPFFPVPPSSFKTDEDDPILDDDAFLAEVAWAKDQAESCGCVCCHTTGVAPLGAAAFDTSAEGIWTDSFTTHGLAIAAGWIDSSPLGAHAALDNNGFDRQVTGLPTTDPERMIRFFEGELARRGATREEFDRAPAVGGPLATQMGFEPESCEAGEGMNDSGQLVWTGGAARYVFVLEADATNPGVPPNLDEPEGTLWKVDVDPESSALTSGISYGVVPSGAVQVVPSSGMAPPLVEGEAYYLYVLRDVGSPITRCIFAASRVPDMALPEDGVDPSWGRVCEGDQDCDGATDFCVKMPGAPSGYCSVHCASNRECTGTGLPGDWTCNAVSCDVEALTWCGPSSEIEESGGFLSVCE